MKTCKNCSNYIEKEDDIGYHHIEKEDDIGYHHIGGKYRKDDFTYILANTGSNLVNLINLKTGARWRDSIRVDDINCITHKEFTSLIYDDDFQRC